VSARRSRGLSSVEFAVVGAVVFIILFGVIEVARAAFSRAMLEEGARRAARLAAVCPVNDPYIVQAARFAEKDWGARIIPGLAAGNIALAYLDAAGATVADPVTDFTDIRFVRITIAGYELPLFLAFLDVTYRPGPVSSTQPVESLGVTPTEITPCLPPP
jgi:hypothetical protein